MEKFKEFVSKISLIKRIALLSFLCLLLQAIVFYLSLIICVAVIQPNSPAMFDKELNSFDNFIFYIVPLILFFSAFVSSLVIFYLATPKPFQRKIFFPALITGLTQTAPLTILIPLTFLLVFYGLNYVLAFAPIYLTIFIALILGNLILALSVPKNTES